MRFDYYYEKGGKDFFFLNGTLQNKIKKSKIIVFLNLPNVLICSYIAMCFSSQCDTDNWQQLLK